MANRFVEYRQDRLNDYSIFNIYSILQQENNFPMYKYNRECIIIFSGWVILKKVNANEWKNAY